MNTYREIFENKCQAINTLGLILIGICFSFIHFKSNPAETQLTYFVLMLPFFFLLPLKNYIYRTELIFILFVVLIFLSSIISYGIQGDIFTKDFRSHWVYLIVFGISAIFTQGKITKKYLLLLVIFSSFMVIYDVFIELAGTGSRGYKAHGKPIFFGNIALTTGLVSFILFLDKRNSKCIKGLLLLSAVAGIAGSIWSQARGGWIFLLLFVLVFSYVYVSRARNKIKASLHSIAFVLALAVISLPFMKEIESRVTSAYSNIDSYFLGVNANTSIGLRFELWRVSFEQFINNPLVGSGRSGFLVQKDQMLIENRVTPRAKIFEHAHSDFFWTLGTKGLVGIFSLYGLYLFLFRFYYIHCKREETKYYAASGITLISGYIVYGLSESFFSIKLGIGYFVILNLILIRLISEKNKEVPVFPKSSIG
jgi:O-antigen ligase